MADFLLQCPVCDRQYDGADGFRLRCDNEVNGTHGPALLRAVYETRQIKVRPELPGIFRFADWLPTRNFSLNLPREQLGEPYCYKSTALAHRLNLKNLHIAFSGFWPERHVNLMTRTFKEFEVQASIAYFLQSFRGREAPPFVIASAGNSGNAYNYYTSLMGLPLYLFVPEEGLSNLLLPFETSPKLVTVEGDYTDAIIIADAVVERCGLVRDGGVLNVGRRGGMSTVMLNAVADPVHGSGHMFDHYVQAVGSGSGAIAAWEAVRLLLTDGRFGDTPTRIHVAQNAPFAPIPRAWVERSEQLKIISDEDAKNQVAVVTAGVLTNRRPPYAIAGGVRDVLRESDGAAWEVSNAALFRTARMFRSLEGIDIGPAASVAVDALLQAVEAASVKPGDRVLLHITGGGRDVQYSHGAVWQATPIARIAAGDVAEAIRVIGVPQTIRAETINKLLLAYS